MASKFTFRTPGGFRDSKTRAIGFLEGEIELDAGVTFDGLAEKDQQNVRNRIDHWIDHAVFTKYHHGFNAPKHRECYVFKMQALRLYGFLCHPRPETAPGFQLCVLTSAAQKHQFATETSLLDLAMRMLEDIRSKEAIAATYPEYYRRKREWKN